MRGNLPKSNLEPLSVKLILVFMTIISTLIFVIGHETGFFSPSKQIPENYSAVPVIKNKLPRIANAMQASPIYLPVDIVAVTDTEVRVRFLKTGEEIVYDLADVTVLRALPGNNWIASTLIASDVSRQAIFTVDEQNPFSIIVVGGVVK